MEEENKEKINLVTKIVILITVLCVLGAVGYSFYKTKTTPERRVLTEEEKMEENEYFYRLNAFEGNVDSSSLKKMLETLADIADRKYDNLEKVPGIYINKLTKESNLYDNIKMTPYDESKEVYINNLNKIIENAETNHTYKVTMCYKNGSNIDFIVIDYLNSNGTEQIINFNSISKDDIDKSVVNFNQEQIN